VTTDAVRPDVAELAASTKTRVIFVSTGNAARGQMAEALLRHEAGDRFEVVSGGTSPQPVNPMAVSALGRIGIDISGAESKSVLRYINVPFDYVITVCDRARQFCPTFPGDGEALHWGIDDPAEAAGDEAVRQAAFDRALRELSGRIRAYIPLATATHG